MPLQLTLCPLLQAFVAGLPVRALRGVGYKSESVLRGWGVVTGGDAAALSKQTLVQGLGERQGECLWRLYDCL
jgi:nucleotidyltransferase/DNA polymerase involved in DNA repair